MQDLIEHLEKDPYQQFLKWYDLAATKVVEVDAMTLATVDTAAKPHIRTVLYKGIHQGMFSFYTNYESDKAKEITNNKNVSLLFYWQQPLGYQVRVEGQVKKLSREQSEAYFASRPRQSQLAAWASPQSHELLSRADLDERMKKIEQDFSNQEVPCPPYWGGYGVLADRFDFMILDRYRLHDRFVYTKTASLWDIKRIAP